MKELTAFERIERLAQKGIHVSINIANPALNTFIIEAKYEGKILFGVDTNDIEAGLNMVVNEMEEQELYEFSATGDLNGYNNRNGYILAKDLADAVLKITCKTDITAKELIGVSKAIIVPEKQYVAFVAVQVDSRVIK